MTSLVMVQIVTDGPRSIKYIEAEKILRHHGSIRMTSPKHGVITISPCKIEKIRSYPWVERVWLHRYRVIGKR